MHILQIPNDILRIIFNDQPDGMCKAIDLCICRFVCRRFRDLIPHTSRLVFLIGDFVEYGYFNIIKWAWSIGAPINAAYWEYDEYETTHICYQSALFERLDILQWAVSKGAKMNEQVFLKAVTNGCVDIMNYIFELEGLGEQSDLTCPWVYAIPGKNKNATDKWIQKHEQELYNRLPPSFQYQFNHSSCPSKAAARTYP